MPESLDAVPVLARAMSEAGRARAPRPRELAALAEGRIAADQWVELARRARAGSQGRLSARWPHASAGYALRGHGVPADAAAGATRPALDREFSRFYREHLRDVYNYTYYRTGNHHDAEDLTTQTFIQAYRHFERAQRESNGRPLRPWLIRIAHNLAANYYRDRKRKPTSALEERWTLGAAARHRGSGRRARGGRCGPRGRPVPAR